MSRTARLVASESRLVVQPIPAFVAVSLLFGAMLIVLSPPLRGPDETAHFLRAYGIARGDFVPALEDGLGRKGIMLPAHLRAGFDYFDKIQVGPKPAGFTYTQAFQDYFRDPPVEAEQPTFVPYSGSEGYSPLAYLPQSTAALTAHLLGLDFVSTLYLMRFAGLCAFTALVAFALTLLPQLAWPFFAIAQLPSVLYGRAMINADGGAFAVALITTTLSLRAVLQPLERLAGRQSFWLMLGALTKPTNLAFFLLPLMAPHARSLRRWVSTGLTVLPAIVAGLFWTLHSEADTAAWRMVEITGRSEEAFNPALKLRHLLENPLELPTTFFATLMRQDYLRGLWIQAVGLLGLFDTVLRSWTYPLLTALLLGTFVVRLPLERRARQRVAAVAGFIIVVYGAGLYLIGYLVFTPQGAPVIWGVQGRYFAPVLPLLASPSRHSSTAALASGSQPHWRWRSDCCLASPASTRC